MKIYVVGIGPGEEKYLTPMAKKAIEESDVIVGYDLYIELIKDLCVGKVIATSGMKQEVKRCEMALSYARKNKIVSMVCSGDPGIYGMAGIIFEVFEKYPQIEIEVIPGITASCSAAAVLGAPLIHDFSVISLSDLLTPWDKIEKRLKLSAEADMVICLYNPRSVKRQSQLNNAVKIMMEFKSGNTPCGFVKNIGRTGEAYALCTLEDLPHKDIDMFTTIIIGNSQTKIINNRLVTPRGYVGI